MLYSRHPLWLSLLFVFTPYAWLAVSSMSQSDSQFMFFSLLTFYYAKTKRLPYALLSCAIASLTRLTAIAFMPFLLYESVRQGKRKLIPIVFLSLAPVGVLFLYFGLDRFLIVSFPVFFAYEDVLCGKGRASLIISLMLIISSVIETYRMLVFFLES